SKGIRMMPTWVMYHRPSINWTSPLRIERECLWRNSFKVSRQHAHPSGSPSPGLSDKQHAKTRYPVLYLDDGYAVFAYWNAEQTVYRLVREQVIQPIILVGIDSAGEQGRSGENLRCCRWAEEAHQFDVLGHAARKNCSRTNFSRRRRKRRTP